jgi:hypothetical protein
MKRVALARVAIRRHDARMSKFITRAEGNFKFIAGHGTYIKLR